MQYDLKQEADLNKKQDLSSLEDLFSKSTEEIIDGLVKNADGNHELALKNLEDYMDTHDGFNRNVLSAHQKLQHKVESMKDSKFNKMIEEAVSTLFEIDEVDRQTQINNIVRRYVIDYTCAEMADSYSTVLREEQAANKYLEDKIAELNITKEELNTALDIAYEDMVVKNQSAFIYDSKYFN